MPANPETNFPQDYRSARKAFIAACEKARVDSIARVHPAATGPKGHPLFLDSAALGPRMAHKALLLIAGSDGKDGRMGSGLLSGLLDARIRLPADARLVMVHGLNPFGMARGSSENEDGVRLDAPEAAESWSFAMLKAILTEDLARVEKLRVLELAGGDDSRMVDGAGSVLSRTLRAFKPGMDLHVARLILVPHQARAETRAVVTRALAAL